MPAEARPNGDPIGLCVGVEYVVYVMSRSCDAAMVGCCDGAPADGQAVDAPLGFKPSGAAKGRPGNLDAPPPALYTSAVQPITDVFIRPARTREGRQDSRI